MKSFTSALLTIVIIILSLISLSTTSYGTDKDDSNLLSPEEIDDMLEEAEKREYCTKYASEENQESQIIRERLDESRLAQSKLYLLIAKGLITRDTWLKNQEHWVNISNKVALELKQLKKKTYDECMSK